jgi:hypothetical protein
VLVVTEANLQVAVKQAVAVVVVKFLLELYHWVKALLTL